MIDQHSISTENSISSCSMILFQLLLLHAQLLRDVLWCRLRGNIIQVLILLFCNVCRLWSRHWQHFPYERIPRIFPTYQKAWSLVSIHIPIPLCSSWCINLFVHSPQNRIGRSAYVGLLNQHERIVLEQPCEPLNSLWPNLFARWLCSRCQLSLLLSGNQWRGSGWILCRLHCIRPVNWN